MSVSIDRRLNLVVPINRADGTTLYVHSEPILRQTFEFYYLPLSRAFSLLAANGLDPRSGPSVAYYVLKEAAQKTQRDGPGTNWWDGPDGVGGDRGLMADVVRLSNAVVPSVENGWASTPLQTALDQRLISEDDKAEVLSILAFFTVVSWAAPWTERKIFVEGLAYFSGLQTLSLNVTDYITSLKTSTPEDTTGKSEKA